MKLFLDANVLVIALNKQYPAFTHVARLMSIPPAKFTLATSPVCLAIAYYFAEKKHGAELAKKKIAVLLEHIEVTACGKKEAQNAITNKQVHDFEDGLEYYSALHDGCRCIVTYDSEDFYFSELEVLDAEAFLRKYYVL
ncbi:MAG: twitching motility protein PilT [Chitinophagia bacterium]|nr:twitching motility protein PilT [Chitinophagia bacterium]